MWFLADGFTADGVLNASVAFVIGGLLFLGGLIATFVGWRTSKRTDTAGLYEKQVGELSERLERQRGSEIARLDSIYRREVASLNKRLEECRREVERWQKRATERGSDDRK